MPVFFKKDEKYNLVVLGDRHFENNGMCFVSRTEKRLCSVLAVNKPCLAGNKPCLFSEFQEISSSDLWGSNIQLSCPMGGYYCFFVKERRVE